ncbi:MAG: starch-binding protein [Ruminococcus sp.]|nr:starch-binding protein [Ruminococcus sp.]
MKPKTHKLISIILAITILTSVFSISASATATTADNEIKAFPVGDADMDGELTIKDASLIQKAIAELCTLDDEQIYYADCNEIEGLQITDVTLIQMYLANITTDYPTNSNGYSLGDYININDIPTVPTTEPTQSSTTTITVGVINYIYDKTSSETANYQLHYWNDTESGDVTCTALNSTESKSVGSDYWSNNTQTFYMYTAQIPNDATGFKFHIGDRWFGDDGSTANSNAVYIFNYSGDKALYTSKVNPTTPTTEPSTPPTDTITITVGVISYVYDKTSSDANSYQIHYWNSTSSGDALCTPLNTTEKKSVGSDYWNNEEQVFYMYTAKIPNDATGFKFHINDRWFGNDGNTANHNTVYAFKYDDDKALYTTSSTIIPTSPIDPSTTPTKPTTPTDPSTTPTDITNPSIPTDGKLNYVFSGKNSASAGYAEGTVSLTADKSATYYLYWADDKKALDGYYEIATLTLNANSTGKFTFDYHTAIPAGATRIIATTSKNKLNVADAFAQYKLPANKLLNTGSGELKYTFNSYSDVHIDPEEFYKNYAEKWAQALNFATHKNTDFIVSSGDMVNFGLNDEWEIYQQILADSNYVNPVYESNGNHDLRTDVANGIKTFVRATGTDNTIANYDANKPYYFVKEKTTGDLFIFMALENEYSTKSSDAFSNKQLDWVTNLLETYYNTGINIYIVEHAPIDGFGAGDRMEDPFYKSHLNQSHQATLKFKSLLQKYPKLIWMSGHTHIDYSLGYNYSNENGTACHMIHNPAVVGSTMSNSAGTGLEYNSGYGFNSQGYYVEVYENQVIYYGANLTDEKIYPAYCYIMDGSRNLGNAQNHTEIAENKTSASNLSAVISTVKSELEQKYKLSSYNQYQELKKSYYKYKNTASVTNPSAAVGELEEKLANLNTIAEHIGYPKIHSTYYFINKLGWSNVYGYAWSGSNNNGSWPGKKLEKIGKYQGYDLYAINFDSNRIYGNLIFSDGSNAKTVDIDLSEYSNNCFTLNGNDMTDGKYKVQNLAYSPNNSSNYALCYYNTGTHTWSDIDTYFTANADGTHSISFTATNSEDISLNIYNMATSQYNCVSASTSLTYLSGNTSNYTLTPSSSRGKSITINGLTAGAKLSFVYNPTNNSLKIICG